MAIPNMYENHTYRKKGKQQKVALSNKNSDRFFHRTSIWNDCL